MSTVRDKAATTASTASLAGVATRSPGIETHHASRETSVMEGVLMTFVFLGLLAATIALGLSAGS